MKYILPAILSILYVTFPPGGYAVEKEDLYGQYEARRKVDKTEYVYVFTLEPEGKGDLYIYTFGREGGTGFDNIRWMLLEGKVIIYFKQPGGQYLDPRYPQEKSAAYVLKNHDLVGQNHYTLPIFRNVKNLPEDR
jgi:hypothetical protein